MQFYTGGKGGAIIIVVLIMLMAFGGIALFMVSGNNSGGSSGSTGGSGGSSGPPPCTTQIDCNATAVLNEAKRYYDQEGQWKGVYTMAPNRANRVNDTTCDVAYTYTKISGGTTGPDKRRFTFQQNTTPGNCAWTATQMGAYQSGTTV